MKNISMVAIGAIIINLSFSAKASECDSSTDKNNPLKGLDWYIVVKGTTCIQGCPATVIKEYKDMDIKLKVNKKSNDFIFLTNESRGYNFVFFRGESMCNFMVKMTSGK